MGTDHQLWTRAGVAGVLAGLVAVLATLAIERLGGLVGGVLSTTPSTIIPALVSIALGNDDDELIVTGFTVPVAFALNLLFLYAWKLGPGWFRDSALSIARQVAIMSVVSVSAWSCAAVGLVFLLQWMMESSRSEKTTIVAAGLVVWFVSIALGVASAIAKPFPMPKGQHRVSLAIHVARGVLAAAAVCSCVLLSSVNGTVAGVASVFPAIFWTAMVSLWLSQGSAVSAGAVSSMVIGGSSVTAYSMLFSAGQPFFRDLLGLSQVDSIIAVAFTSYFVSVLCCSLPSVLFLRRIRTTEFSVSASTKSSSSTSTGSTSALLVPMTQRGLGHEE